MKTFLFLISFCALVLFISLRGLPGNFDAQSLNSPKWDENGPFELSVERGRFALTYSLVENKSVFFSLPISRFATPDLGYKNGKYVSLFAPGLSFMLVPGYLIGKFFGLAQLGTYFFISLFALANSALVYLISRRFSVHKFAAGLSALTFLFATPAFAYSVSLYQHHVSTFLVLTALYLLLVSSRFWSLCLVWFLIALSIPIDYPNLFLQLPLAIMSVGKFLQLVRQNHSLQFKINPIGFFSLFAVLPPLLFFLWFNKVSYGDPLQLSGTVAQIRAIDAAGLPTTPKSINPNEDLEKEIHPELQKKSAVRFFKSRNLLDGLYIHLISLDRGVLIFTPVILLGILGAYYLYRQSHPFFPVIVGVLGADLLLYSLWGDPWGGWAFGSRYLIPGYAILAILVGLALNHWRKKIFVMCVFLVLFIYSVAVNTLGAVTSSRNPPQVEILALEKLSGRIERYSFDRNLEFIKANRSKSFLFDTYAKKYLTASQYFLIISGSINLVALLFLIRLSSYDRS